MLFQPFTCINRHCVSEMANNYCVNRLNGGSVTENVSARVCVQAKQKAREQEQKKGRNLFDDDDKTNKTMETAQATNASHE